MGKEGLRVSWSGKVVQPSVNTVILDELQV